MTINKDTLRAQALEMFNIPGHYRLVMEDDIPAGQPMNRAFVWEDPENMATESEIWLDLATGILVNADVKTRFCKGLVMCDSTSSSEQAREMADSFVANYVREAGRFTWAESMHSIGFKFVYREEAGGLPLPYTGCEVVLDQQLENIRYRYYRRSAPVPIWPAKLIEEQLVMDQILAHSRMELHIAAIPTQSGEMKGTEAEFRLVYQLVSQMWLMDAVTGEDIYGAEHYAVPTSCSIISDHRLSGASENKGVVPESNVHLSITEWEKLLGIDPNIHMLEKSSEDDDCLYLAYCITNMEVAGLEASTLSIDSYMNSKWGEVLKQREAPYRLQIEKTTGMLLRFHRNEPEVQQPSNGLSRNECWQKAEQFLASVFAEYAAWLRLEEPADANHSEQRRCELFCLPVYRGDIPVQGELVMVSVNTTNGKVCHYKGISGLMLQQLNQVNLRPKLSPNEALEVCKQSLELKWHRKAERENKQFSYQLIYGLSALQDKDELQSAGIRKQRYVDACSGAIV
ncbi:hypothetical protein D3C75_163400 [compost metagenome]